MNNELFPLYACWQEPFEQLGASLKKLISQRELDPQQMAAVARLAYAIDRLPNPTNGIEIEASATVSNENSRGWLQLTHCGDLIELSYWESIYERQDTSHRSTKVLQAEVGVGVDREGDDPITVMNELESWVAEWTNRVLNPECEFEVTDSLDEVDWNQAVHAEGWEALPDGV
jgi:hypothetical protein